MKVIQIFARPTRYGKKRLSTSYNIPHWKHFFDKKLYEEKHTDAERRKGVDTYRFSRGS